MPVERLRIHVAIAHGGERLDAEEEAVEKPMGGRSGNTVLAQAVKAGEKEIKPDINRRHKSGELRPLQTQQPAINIAPFPRVSINFDELDLP